MEKTPVKTDIDVDALSATMSKVNIKVPTSEYHSDESETDIRGDSFRAKREFDMHTIEGSPFIHLHKRVDVNPTPAKSSTSGTDYIVSSGLISPVKNTPARKPEESKTKLLVVCSASEDHDTGEHQENARRTKLLCGLEEGCLRRASVGSHIDWIDSTSLPPPPLTDLLR
jgi:hypothetical protein